MDDQASSALVIKSNDKRIIHTLWWLIKHYKLHRISINVCMIYSHDTQSIIIVRRSSKHNQAKKRDELCYKFETSLIAEVKEEGGELKSMFATLLCF